MTDETLTTEERLAQIELGIKALKEQFEAMSEPTRITKTRILQNEADYEMVESVLLNAETTEGDE
jgi:hypothetical protein